MCPEPRENGVEQTPVRNRLQRFPQLSSKVIHIDDPHRAERRRVEAFVEDTYARTYGSRIQRHYPTLMSIQDDTGRIYAVVGFRLARDGALFLEQYLDTPVEAAINARADRVAIAEVGNLASDGRGATVFLFLSLADHLRTLGCEYAVATATRELRGIFHRVGFPVMELGRADPSRLPDAGQSWGGYYSTDPIVLAGSISQTLPNLNRFASSNPAERPLHPRLHYTGCGGE